MSEGMLSTSCGVWLEKYHVGNGLPRLIDLSKTLGCNWDRTKQSSSAALSLGEELVFERIPTWQFRSGSW